MKKNLWRADSCCHDQSCLRTQENMNYICFFLNTNPYRCEYVVSLS